MMENFKAFGFGVYVSKHRRLEGMWLDDKMQGYGKEEKFSNGEIYEGHFTLG